MKGGSDVAFFCDLLIPMNYKWEKGNRMKNFERRNVVASWTCRMNLCLYVLHPIIRQF